MYLNFTFFSQITVISNPKLIFFLKIRTSKQVVEKFENKTGFNFANFKIHKRK